jgi:mitochondrial import receptor subunit TOM70
LAVFDKAIKINPQLPLPYLNQAIIHSHVKNDVGRGIELTQRAIAVDPLCELAYMHLAQMYMAQGKVEDSIKTYEKALELARTESDAENALMGIEASRAQQRAMQYLAQQQ